MSARRTTAPRSIARSTSLSRRAAVVAGAVALGLTATACGGDSASSDTKSLTMLAVQDSASLDPFKVSYVAVADEPRMSALYDPLVYIDPKDGQVKPHLAEGLSSPDGGVTWVLKLRQGVTFSDGTPFDAEAVKQTWEAHAKEETGSLHRPYAAGLQLTVTDPLTLTVKPIQPNPNFDRTVATQLTYIIAPSALAKGLQEAGTHPIGAGPFKLQSWTRGSEQVFVRNETYWQKDKGLPKLDKLTIKNVPDIQQQLNTVKNGQADIFHSSDPQLLDRGKKELQAIEQQDLGGQMVQFNLRKPPFDDIRARRAIALALDPADIPKTVGNGYVPAKGFFNQASQFFDPSVSQPAPDKAEAQRLFDELAAEGRKVDFTYLIPQNPSSQKVAEFMQSRLAQFQNVSMKIESLEIGAYIVKYAVQRDFQAMLFQQWQVEPEPEMFNSFFSQSPLNYVGWKNEQADAALTAGRTSTDPAVRKQAYADLQRALVADLPIWVYAQSSIGPIFSKNVTGVELYNTGVVFMDRIGKK